ncbi:hypothetical protein SAMD00019534_066210 [Acytostelium subglobosum LB1]|uniref:hypothetical protein n=1 Tax=Acytostelium subglobosum LB1 TaxID=1410327 RepID=UPI000644C6D1|nr:hypothetical protein SAMD00019534_066210 [Acytostelium subglobosum LB1]GAM23446.1 hypothetical protein SAMD00019534_066210 [Acytostelium subglobosum LB1]|eukprot:XP_012753895.1 hypothetical protein SAMD00019534_066210 [Acytostelium subglobosum LB1]
MTSSNRYNITTAEKRTKDQFPLIKNKLIKHYTSDLNKALLDKHLKHIAVERVSGTPSIKTVAKYITAQFDEDHWTVEQHTFDDSTPFGRKSFTNIVITSKHPDTDPHAPTLILAAHYDSKMFKEFKFVAATDSAVSIAMIIEIAKSMEELLEKEGKRRLKLIFFDGEEAFVDWTDTDSLYGSRRLAKHLANHTIHHHETGESKAFYETVDFFMLLDLIGGPNPTFYPTHHETVPLFNMMVDIEDRLSSKRIFRPRKYFSNHFIGNEVQDDHIPFKVYNIPIMHLITMPFPSCWHKACDDLSNVDHTVVEDLTKIFKVFIASYLSH